MYKQRIIILAHKVFNFGVKTSELIGCQEPRPWTSYKWETQTSREYKFQHHFHHKEKKPYRQSYVTIRLRSSLHQEILLCLSFYWYEIKQSFNRGKRNLQPLWPITLEAQEQIYINTRATISKPQLGGEFIYVVKV